MDFSDDDAVVVGPFPAFLFPVCHKTHHPNQKKTDCRHSSKILLGPSAARKALITYRLLRPYRRHRREGSQDMCFFFTSPHQGRRRRWEKTFVCVAMVMSARPVGQMTLLVGHEGWPKRKRTPPMTDYFDGPQMGVVGGPRGARSWPWFFDFSGGKELRKRWCCDLEVEVRFKVGWVACWLLGISELNLKLCQKFALILISWIFFFLYFDIFLFLIYFLF